MLSYGQFLKEPVTPSAVQFFAQNCILPLSLHRDDDLSYKLIQVVDGLKATEESMGRDEHESRVIIQVSEFVFELNQRLRFKSYKDLTEAEKRES